MFNKEGIRNLTTRAKFIKSKSHEKNDILIYLKNKKKIISKNIIKYEKDLSECLNDYKRKSDINNSIYQNHKNIYQNFEKINSIIREKQKPKEEKLISDIMDDYYHKKNMDISKDEMKENIFEVSALIEKNLNRLKMDYLLNYKKLKKEIKENKSYNDIFLKLAQTKKSNKNSNLKNENSFNNNLPGIKLSRQINNLNAVKFMKKLDIIAKSKMLDNKKYSKGINKIEIKNKLEELEKSANIEQKINYQHFVRNSLRDIQKLKEKLNTLDNEENSQNVINLLSKRSKKGKSLFYIPTLVKSFPELLYDKLNKNKSNISKGVATNDSSSPSLIRSKEKPGSHRIIYKYNLYKNKDNKNHSVSKVNSKFLTKFKEMLNTSKLRFSKIDPNLFKTTINEKSSKTFNKKNVEENDETTQMYNHILDMSTEDRNSIRNRTMMTTFLKEKNNKYLNSVNERRSKDYYKTLKRIHLQFDKDLSTEKFYDSYNLLNNEKTNYLFNQIKNFQKTLRMNEKLLIKSLLIEKS